VATIVYSTWKHQQQHGQVRQILAKGCNLEQKSIKMSGKWGQHEWVEEIKKADRERNFGPRAPGNLGQRG